MIKQYNFSDFLPLTERKAGYIYSGGRPSAVWVVNPNWAPNHSQVQFRTPVNPQTWASDVWEKRSSGPLDLPHWYLNSHVLRKYKDPDDPGQGTEDFEFEIEQDKSILKMSFDDTWYVVDVSESGSRGIPYFRQSWNIGPSGSLTHIVQNWYWILDHMGQRAHRIFHHQLFEHDLASVVTGPEWKGGAPSEREHILLSEAYWDHNLKTDSSEWLIGGGEMGADEPTGENIIYGRTRSHAYKTGSDAGIMAFRSDTNGALAGTRSTWNY
jgi:hypothetical protein